MEHRRNRDRLPAAPAAVTIYRIRNHYRSGIICDAWRDGLRAAGVAFQEVFEDQVVGIPDEQLPGRVAIFYGLAGEMWRVFRAYSNDPARRAVCVDMGYFGRRDDSTPQGRWTGYHKVAVDSRHPVAYYRRNPKPDDRLNMFHVEQVDWRATGTHILLAGMGDKGARAEGFEPEEWELAMIQRLRRLTDRPIVYRAKPSWKGARPLPFSRYSVPGKLLRLDLVDCWAIVTHHSNVAMDGILAGVPAFCWGGVGADMGTQELGRIEDPAMPDGRWQWASDIAYTQWNVAEMRAGAAWSYLERDGLL